MLPDIDLRACYNQSYRLFALAAFATGLLVKAPVLRYVAGISWLKSGAFFGDRTRNTETRGRKRRPGKRA